MKKKKKKRRRRRRRRRNLNNKNNNNFNNNTYISGWMPSAMACSTLAIMCAKEASCFAVDPVS